MAETIKCGINGRIVEYDCMLVQYANVNKLIHDILVGNEGLLYKIAKEYAALDSADQLYNYCEHLIQKIPKIIAMSLTQYAISFNIYDVTEENVWDYDPDRSCLVTLAVNLGIVIDKYIDVKNAQFNEEQRRAIRKETRMRIIGGGFGLKGAAMGMLQAGAINMTTGIAHGVFNSIGNFIDRQKARIKINEIYKDPQTLLLILEGVEESFFEAFYMFTGVALGICVGSSQSLTKADNMLENLRNNNIPKEQQEEIVTEIIRINPLLTQAYKYVHLNSNIFDKFFIKDLDKIWNIFQLNYVNDTIKERIRLCISDEGSILEYLIKEFHYVVSEHEFYEYLARRMQSVNSGSFMPSSLQKLAFTIAWMRNTELFNDVEIVKNHFDLKAYVDFYKNMDEPLSNASLDFIISGSDLFRNLNGSKCYKYDEIFESLYKTITNIEKELNSNNITMCYRVMTYVTLKEFKDNIDLYYKDFKKLLLISLKQIIGKQEDFLKKELKYEKDQNIHLIACQTMIEYFPNDCLDAINHLEHVGYTQQFSIVENLFKKYKVVKKDTGLYSVLLGLIKNKHRPAIDFIVSNICNDLPVELFDNNSFNFDDRYNIIESIYKDKKEITADSTIYKLLLLLLENKHKKSITFVLNEFNSLPDGTLTKIKDYISDEEKFNIVKYNYERFNIISSNSDAFYLLVSSINNQYKPAIDFALNNLNKIPYEIFNSINMYLSDDQKFDFEIGRLYAEERKYDKDLLLQYIQNNNFKAITFTLKHIDIVNNGDIFQIVLCKLNELAENLSEENIKFIIKCCSKFNKRMIKEKVLDNDNSMGLEFATNKELWIEYNKLKHNTAIHASNDEVFQILVNDEYLERGIIQDTINELSRLVQNGYEPAFKLLLEIKQKYADEFPKNLNEVWQLACTNVPEKFKDDFNNYIRKDSPNLIRKVGTYLAACFIACTISNLLFPKIFVYLGTGIYTKYLAGVTNAALVLFIFTFIVMASLLKLKKIERKIFCILSNISLSILFVQYCYYFANRAFGQTDNLLYPFVFLIILFVGANCIASNDGYKHPFRVFLHQVVVCFFFYNLYYFLFLLAKNVFSISESTCLIGTFVLMLVTSVAIVPESQIYIKKSE